MIYKICSKARDALFGRQFSYFVLTAASLKTAVRLCFATAFLVTALSRPNMCNTPATGTISAAAREREMIVLYIQRQSNQYGLIRCPYKKKKTKNTIVANAHLMRLFVFTTLPTRQIKMPHTAIDKVKAGSQRTYTDTHTPTHTRVNQCETQSLQRVCTHPKLV